MAYHTAVYLFLFLPAVLLAYQLAPGKWKRAVLLAAGYVFFWSFSGWLVLFPAGTTLFTYGMGEAIVLLKNRCGEKTEQAEKSEKKKIKAHYRRLEKAVLAAGIAVLLSVLGYLKYYNFFVQNFNMFASHTETVNLLQAKNLILPIGISFYTLQAVGYLADVYWGKIRTHSHPGKLALFLGFFPQIMEGPISMYSQTADQLWECRPLKGQNLADGSVRILWGLFKKMIIADRLSVMVQAIFDNYRSYSGIVIAAAAVAYTVQLYMEFSGCMDMVNGTGCMFGITLPENFRQPFLSMSAAEFWRRWHITLGAWFKTYIFYPVSVSGPVKKWNRFGKTYLNRHLTKVGVSAMSLFPVWLCNGLWHGARWSYIFYGMYYFVILLAAVALEPVRDGAVRACRIKEDAGWWKTLRILKTWIIIFTGELFFRANGLIAGTKMFRSIFRNFAPEKLWDGTFLGFGLDKGDWLVIFCGCAAVAVVGIIKERKLLGDTGMRTMRTPVRWALYYALIFSVIIFGAYGVGYQQADLIYAGF